MKNTKFTGLEVAIMEMMECVYCRYWFGNKAEPYFYQTMPTSVTRWDEVEFPFVLRYEGHLYPMYEYWDLGLIREIAQVYLKEIGDTPDCPEDYLEELVKDMWGDDYKWFGAEPIGIDECVTPDRRLPSRYLIENNLRRIILHNEVN